MICVSDKGLYISNCVRCPQRPLDADVILTRATLGRHAQAEELRVARAEAAEWKRRQEEAAAERDYWKRRAEENVSG